MDSDSHLRRCSDLTMENERLREELACARAQLRSLLRQATTDELTGLLNRRGFQQLAVEEMRRAQSRLRTLTLIYVDVDGLKALNDRAGHEAGDALLVETAALLRTAFRAGDVVARLGGDEFAVLTRGFHGDTAVVRRRIEQVSEALRGSGAQTQSISLSTGVVLVNPGMESGLDELLACADHAMYAEKRRKYAVARAARRPSPVALSVAV